MEYINIIIPILALIIPLIIGKKFRELTYLLFLEAEKIFKISKSGKEKFEYVIEQIYIKVPILKILMPKSFLRKYIQYLFDTIKDLLEDGKIER